MATFKDTYANTTYLASLTGSEVDGGQLRNEEVSYAALLDGVNDTITIGSITSADDLCLDGSNFTIHAWIRTVPQVDVYPRIVDKSTGTSGTGGYSLVISNSGDIYLCIDGLCKTLSNIITFDSQWHHIAWTLDGANWKGYWDGVLVGTFADLNFAPTDTASLQIGGRPGSTAQDYKGSMARVYIHDAALTAREISQIFKTKIVPTGDIADFWLLDETSGTDAASNSGSFDGTLGSGASFDNSFPYYIGLSETKSTNLGLALTDPASITNFAATPVKQAGGATTKLQFSPDNTHWEGNTGTDLTIGAYLFDGINDKITTSFSATIKTVCFWIYQEEGADDWATATKIIQLSAVGPLYIELASNVYTASAGATNSYLDGIDTDSGNDFAVHDKWQHVAITSSAGWAVVNPIFGAVGSDYFDGLLTDIRLYSDVLTATEIENLALNGQAPTDNLEANYVFNGNADDQSGNGRDGTASGATNTTEYDSLPKLGYNLGADHAHQCDGINDYIQITNAGDIRTIAFWVKSNHFGFAGSTVPLMRMDADALGSSSSSSSSSSAGSSSSSSSSS